MNRNDDFDRALGVWLHGEAPPQAPDRVLDAALERVGSESQRRSWLQRLVGGTPMATMTRVAAVTAMVAITALIGFQFYNLIGNVGDAPSPTPEPTASATPSASPSSPAPSGAPGEGSLVLRLESRSDGGPSHIVTVLDDGRVITRSEAVGENLFLERRLTPQGVQLVRDELAATGLADAPGNYQPILKPGVAEPVDRVNTNGFFLQAGLGSGSEATITWLAVANGEDRYYEASPEREALDALLARLSTLEAWLPASAWADAAGVPYEPETYRMVIGYQRWGGSLDDLPVEIGTVSWPLDNEIGAFGEVTNPAPDKIRCGMVGAEDGAAVIDALEVAGASAFGLSFGLGDRANNRHVTITLEPILPLDEGTC